MLPLVCLQTIVLYPVQGSFLCELAYVYCSQAAHCTGVFTGAHVNVQTCLKARILPRWCLSLFLSGVRVHACMCACVCACALIPVRVHARQGHWCLTILLYSIGRKSLTEPAVRLAANQPRVYSGIALPQLFSHGCWDANSGPRDCTARASPP